MNEPPSYDWEAAWDDLDAATSSVPQISDDMSQLESAFALAAVGMHVFPVDHPGLAICAGIGKGHDPFSPNHDRGKHPCVKWGEKATNKAAVIRAYWSQGPRNIGIHCGKSGFVVVDEDRQGEFKRYADEHGVKIPHTLVVATAKGRHYYFLAREDHPLGNEEGAFGDYDINIRAGNGFVVGPGSVHETGVAYRIEVAEPPAPIPDWVIDGIKTKTNGHKTTTVNGVLFEGVGGFEPFELPEVIKEHHRDTTLFKFACSMRAQRLNRQLAKVVMERAWERCEQPPETKTEFTLDEALAKVDNAYDNYEEGRSEEYQKQTESDEPEAATFDTLVAKEAVKLKVREAARALVDAERRGPLPPFDAGTLGEMLARPRPPQARVDGLIPWEASTLIPAQRKTGKTTLLLNLSRSLLTGELFLGTFDVQPVDGLVALLNYEVSGETIAQWADQAGLDPDRFFIVNLRGRRNPLADPEDRARLAELLRGRGTESLLVDPFGRAYTGQSQNDSAEVGGWLIELDRFTRSDVGARDLILTTHAGWNQERTRGSSALEDWADSIITMIKDDSDDGDGERYIRAIGRDVDLEEDQLIYDPTTRALTLAGTGSRKSAKATRQNDKLDRAVLEVVTAKPGLNTTQIGEKVHAAGVSFQRGDIGHAATRLVEAGHLRIESGPRNAKLHYPTENLFDDRSTAK